MPPRILPLGHWRKGLKRDAFFRIGSKSCENKKYGPKWESHENIRMKMWFFAFNFFIIGMDWIEYSIQFIYLKDMSWNKIGYFYDFGKKSKSINRNRRKFSVICIFIGQSTLIIIQFNLIC